jgi:hypothetical protein
VITYDASVLYQDVTLSSYGNLPLSFESNTGQTDESVKFLSRGGGFSLFLTKDEAVIALGKTSSSGPAGKKRTAKALPTSGKNTSSSASTLRMQLLGVKSDTHVVGAEELPGKANYFIGNDPSKWRTNVPTYARVKYEGVYPGVDLVYYGKQGQLEYDFVVAPGADPRVIRLKLDGTRKLRIDKNGNLLMETGGNEARFEKPQAYQETNGTRRAVACNYWITSANTFGFRVAGFDRRKPLVIDPVFLYSTYLGGTGDDQAAAIAVDPAGNAYLTGTTASPNFPAVNAIQSTFGGGNSYAFVTKINAAGTTLVYSTYLGGGGENGYDIALDSAGNVYVTGLTYSPNFPLVNAIQSTFGGFDDAFVTKINANGSALVYSTYLGGSDDDRGFSIAVDSAGNAYVTGLTTSPDFPTANAIQSTLGTPITPGTACCVNPDAFVTKINANGSALVYSTYLGGTDYDVGLGIAADSGGNAYAAGVTASANFPTFNALQSLLRGSHNAFITKINASGAALVYSTFLGGSGYDTADDIALDPAGNAYVTGLTSSPDFPLVGPLQSIYGGGSFDAFVTKINASGAALVYSTFLGGSGYDEGRRVAVDSGGNAYVVGGTGSANFPTVNAIQSSFGGGSAVPFDAFVSKIDASGSTLVYSTYLGGSGDDYGLGVALDSTATAYVVGYTYSANFPTANAFQSALGGAEDGFVSKIASQSFKAFVQQPINPDGSTVFKASRGVVPVKFTLTENGAPTCALPPATIAVTRTAGGTPGSVDESVYTTNADSGSNFRIDTTACQYIYNLGASSLGVATYRVDISINGFIVGDAMFALE